MPYTYWSLTLVWLIGLAIVVLCATGLVTGVGVVLLVIVALIMPTLLLRVRAKPTIPAGPPVHTTV